MRIKVSDGKKTTMVGQETEFQIPASNSLAEEFAALKRIVDEAYQQPTLISDAEKLAARFLSAQILIAEHLSSADLDARMRKNGLKAVKAGVYMTAATATEKKPSDTLLENHVTLDKVVQSEQDAYDRADAHREMLMIYLGIAKEGHIYFRGISKGRYE